MKKVAAIIAAFAVAVLFEQSCTKVQETEDVKASIVFDAEIDLLSRTVLDGVQVQWKSGDEVDIFSSSGVVTYVATPDAGDARKASFTKKNLSDPEPEPLPSSLGSGKYAALYPAGIATMSESGPMVTLPSTQRYNQGGDLSNVSVMFANSDDTNLTFVNAFGLLSLKIRGTKTVSRIVVKTKETNISGLFDYATFLMSPDPEEAHKWVELDCSPGVALTEEGTVFYIGIPALTVPRGELTITVTATDGSTSTITNDAADAVFQMGHVSPYTWTPVFELAPLSNPNDLLEAFTSGYDLTVGGRTYNIGTNTYASVRLSQLSSGSDFTSSYLDGRYDVVFLDYDSVSDKGHDKLIVSDTDLAPSDGVAIVGRYTDHHSEIEFGSKMFLPKGSLALRNICVRTDTWAIQTKNMLKNDCRFDIQDCAFYITPDVGAQGGLISDNCTSTGDVSTVLGSLTLKNSVVVRHNDSSHAMFAMLVGSYGTIPYRDFVIENNAFIYESKAVGKEVCTSNLFSMSSDSEVKNSYLNFTFRNNSVYGYKGNGTVLTCCDPKCIVLENNVMEVRLSTKVFMLNIFYPYSKLSSSTSRISGNYCNNSGAFISGADFLNGDALKAKFAVGDPSNFVTGVSPFYMVEPNIGYISHDASVIGNAGCSYDTKVWRFWAADMGAGSESYGEGHSSGEFGWE